MGQQEILKIQQYKMPMCAPGKEELLAVIPPREQLCCRKPWWAANRTGASSVSRQQRRPALPQTIPLAAPRPIFSLANSTSTPEANQMPNFL